MSNPRAPAYHERLRAHVAQFGEPMPESDLLYQGLIVPSIRAAFRSLPHDLDYSRLREQPFDLRFFCVKNEGQPDILCSKFSDTYLVIFNLNLVNHLYNLSRQLLCMRDVLSNIGDSNLERRQRQRFNRHNPILDLKLNIYQADVECEYLPLSPNKEPRCPVRREAYILLFWFMLEHLILHELSHIFQGHLRAEGGRTRSADPIEPAESHFVNRSSALELLADILAASWFSTCDPARLRNSYGPVLGALEPSHRRGLRLVAPALSYWAFSSYSPEFCLDVRKYDVAITGFSPESDSAYLPKNFRIAFVEDLADRALDDTGLSAKLRTAARELAATWKKELRARAQFYEPLSLFNRILDEAIGTEIGDHVGSIDAWIQETEPQNVVGANWRRFQIERLTEWAVRYRSAE